MSNIIKKLTKKQIILILSLVILVPLLAYAGSVGYRLYKIYTAVYQDIDDFVPVDPNDLIDDDDNDEPIEDDIPQDAADAIKEQDNPIYEVRSPRDPNKLNILLIGTDLVGNTGGHRSDTMMIVQFDKITKKSAILSIPRDTYIKIPGRGYDKAGHAYAYGGARLLKQTLEGYLDIHIDHYAQVGMEGFGTIIDVLGGIPVEVKHDMVHSIEGHTIFKKGSYHMNGTQVLDYVRARHLTTGGSDFGRIKRQQEVMVIIFKQIRNNFSLNRTLNVMEAIAPYLRTDVGASTVMSNWSNFTSVNPATIELKTLQGTNFVYNRTYFYRVPIADARQTMKNLTN